MSQGKTPVFSFGIILFAFGGVLFFLKAYLEWNSEGATATVTSISERIKVDSLGNPTTYYDPTIWYVVHTGDTIKNRIYSNYADERYTVGQHLSIVYKRDNVTEFYNATSFWWYVPLGMIFLAGIAIMYFSTKLKSEDWS